MPYDRAPRLSVIVDLGIDIGTDTVGYNTIVDRGSLSNLEVEISLVLSP